MYSVYQLRVQGILNKHIQLFPCFLHQMNTTIGKICTFSEMKKIISKANRIVSFFNSSHYWGGQLKEEALRNNVSRGLKRSVDTRFYSLSLMALSILSNK